MLAPDTHRELRPAAKAGALSGTRVPGLPEIPLGWTETEFRVLDRCFRLLVPFRPDSLLDSPEVLSANALDDYMPYWAYLWPAALHIAESMLKNPWPRQTRVLELGCGLGLVGIAALASGCQVSLTDYDVNAIMTAKMNAALNGFPDADAFVLDWRSPPESTYSVIIGCDITYESRNHIPILDLIDRMLEPHGLCWIADGGRNAAPAFVELARIRGYSVGMRDHEGKEITDPGFHYVLMELRKR
jgi:predicted nicotinamide N-methyase